MNINAEKMDRQEMNMSYEQPTLKKYGTMKELTYSAAGSTGDALGKGRDGTINNAANVIGGVPGKNDETGNSKLDYSKLNGDQFGMTD